MNDPPRIYPALELAWPPSTADVAALQDRLAAFLHDLGVSAVQEFDGSWLAFFPTARERDRAARSLAASGADLRLGVTPRDVRDEDWARRSQAHLAPVTAGRFIVAPPWSDVESDRARHATVIRIRPSMGVGTGHHATTRLCLEAIESLDLAGRSFLDVGTGSGVLAIAASLLGARPVTAIDNDPDAVESARDNVQLNGAADSIRLVIGDVRDAAGLHAKTVAANLTGAALVQECRALAALVEPGGTIVISGFTSDEAEVVVGAFGRLGDVTARSEEDGWCAAVIRIAPTAE